MRARIIALSLLLITAGSTRVPSSETEDDGGRSVKPSQDADAPAASSFHTINEGPSHDKRIALTFDDGPHSTLTPKVLEVLRNHGVKATFFVLGERLELYPSIVNQIVAEGHELGNHTYSHRSLADLSTDQIAHEISETQNLIKLATGYEPHLFRPPYGAFRSNATTVFQKYDLSVIRWSVDPQDWRIRDEDHIYHFVISHVRNGSIVLLHDIHPTTIAALPRILDTLLAEGYQLVTVNELCDLPPLVPKRESATTKVPNPLVMHEPQE